MDNTIIDILKGAILLVLENLDKELIEKAWNDNQFWPY